MYSEKNKVLLNQQKFNWPSKNFLLNTGQWKIFFKKKNILTIFFNLNNNRNKMLHRQQKSEITY